MSTPAQYSLSDLSLFGMEELKKKWGWFVAIGLLLIVGGTIALGSAYLMTVFSVMFLGWLMGAAGVLEIIHAFGVKKWSGFFLDLLTGLLYLVAGFFMIADPGIAAITLTLLIAMLLIVEGILRILVSIAVRYPHWGWTLLNGVVTLILGIAVWRQLPLSGLWVIGLFVGIDMIFNGWSLVMLGLTAKGLSTSSAPASGPIPAAT